MIMAPSPDYKYPLKMWIVLHFFFLVFPGGFKIADGQNTKPVRVGILTDCQYCNCPSVGNRNYMRSLSKLDSCISAFNSLSLDAIFHLGDMIETTTV
jgi:manganese-dependent ADP-ribose/CDP-alcohol diphosphatase